VDSLSTGFVEERGAAAHHAFNSVVHLGDPVHERKGTPTLGTPAMIHGLALLLLCQLAGETLAKGLTLPVPGPVIGIVLLVAGLALWRKTSGRDAVEEDTLSVATVADGFLRHLALLFVPAGVGVVALAPLLGPHALTLLLALVISTVVTLVVTVQVFVAVRKRLGGGES
jgi:putative effector of murein hydrolase LrgA (UPF0299 family)